MGDTARNVFLDMAGCTPGTARNHIPSRMQYRDFVNAKSLPGVPDGSPLTGNPVRRPPYARSSGNPMLPLGEYSGQQLSLIHI